MHDLAIDIMVACGGHASVTKFLQPGYTHICCLGTRTTKESTVWNHGGYIDIDSNHICSLSMAANSSQMFKLSGPVCHRSFPCFATAWAERCCSGKRLETGRGI